LVLRPELWHAANRRFDNGVCCLSQFAVTTDAGSTGNVVDAASVDRVIPDCHLTVCRTLSFGNGPGTDLLDVAASSDNHITLTDADEPVAAAVFHIDDVSVKSN
jgi:hypothetical protein